MPSRIFTVATIAAASLGLAACTSGYGSYGLSAGYGSGYYDGYGYDGYGSSYYPSSYYGWNNGFYYPGTGYYLYDTGGRRHRWSDSQRRYWESRRDRREVQANWSAFRQDRRQDRNAYRTERREDRQGLRSGQVTRPEFRQDRAQDRKAYRAERREDRQDLRRENRRDRRN